MSTTTKEIHLRHGLVRLAKGLGIAERLTKRARHVTEMAETEKWPEIRKELVTRHVTESERPLTEVAMLLGFSAPSAFSRWYQVQFGRSAKQSLAARPAVPRE